MLSKDVLYGILLNSGCGGSGGGGVTHFAGPVTQIALCSALDIVLTKGPRDVLTHQPDKNQILVHMLVDLVLWLFLSRLA